MRSVIAGPMHPAARRIKKPKPGPKLTRVIVGPREPAPPPLPEEYEARGRKTDELLQDMIRRASQKSATGGAV